MTLDDMWDHYRHHRSRELTQKKQVLENHQFLLDTATNKSDREYYTYHIGNLNQLIAVTSTRSVDDWSLMYGGIEDGILFCSDEAKDMMKAARLYTIYRDEGRTAAIIWKLSN